MEKNFVYPAKTLSQHRNKFKMPFTSKTTFNHGKLYPLCAPIEVLPGDTFKVDIASLIRMSTPIAPIMDNISMHIAAYFVPLRLLYEHFEEVMGANKDGAWITDKTSYVVPMWQSDDDDNPNSIMNHFGLPSDGLKFSALPFRAYCLIWNEFYRSQVVSSPIPIDFSTNGSITVDGSIFPSSDCLPLGKFADYFTKCLPEPQKHAAIPFLPENLNVGFIAGASGTTESSIFGGVYTGSELVKDDFTKLLTSSNGGVSGNGYIDIIASVEEAWNNINALRFAFQLQKFYEKDARYGTRYFEMLNGHFGVTNPDLVLQRPQHLGEVNFRINIDQVLSTAGYSADDSTTVGAPGANSVTGGKGALFTGSFSEFGYIIIVGGARHEHTYPLFRSPLWTREDRLDFYDPVFANIGEQPVMETNLAVIEGNGDPGDADYKRGTDLSGVFGYQEAWAELRFIPNQVTGLLNPAAANNLGFWTLADEYDEAPLLNENFIYENRNSIARALVTGETGPDYIADFYFDCTAVRPLPLFSIPGLSDHH